ALHAPTVLELHHVGAGGRGNHHGAEDDQEDRHAHRTLQYTLPAQGGPSTMATDYAALEQQLVTHLGITRRPVAVAFRATPPAGVEKFSGVEPSGCSFWRLAGAGRTFYTAPTD